MRFDVSRLNALFSLPLENMVNYHTHPIYPLSRAQVLCENYHKIEVLNLLTFQASRFGRVSPACQTDQKSKCSNMVNTFAENFLTGYIWTIVWLPVSQTKST